MERLDLADRLEESHQRNGELVQLGLAAPRASTERDARRIATLEARLRSAQELHRATVEATREDREGLQRRGTSWSRLELQ
jgi:flagellar motility protein MotE (MotC chaperone)